MLETEQSKSKDRRIGRTQQLLRDALESLIVEKPYTDITVQDIIDRANVGRSTFYAHFLDKDHLLKSNMERLSQSFAEQYKQTIERAHHTNSPHTMEQARIEATLFLFQHAQSHYPAHKALIKSQSSDWLVNQFECYFIEILRDHLSQSKPDERLQGVPMEVLVQYMASALMGLLTWWLEENLPYTAEQMNQWFHTMTMQPLFNHSSPAKPLHPQSSK